MDDYDRILNKINLLGGIKSNPACDNKESNVRSEDIDIHFYRLEEMFKAKLPEAYKLLYKNYGAFSFANPVLGKLINSELTKGVNTVSVDYFYSMTDSSCSIFKIIERYESQLPDQLFPFCDGESGDLICINFQTQHSGKICYWHHESGPGKDLYQMANNFESFILSLELSKDRNTDSQSLEDIEVQTTPKLLEMLRKSGYGPK
jgi:hypothetical protein